MQRRVVSGRAPIHPTVRACLTVLIVSLLLAPAFAQAPTTGTGSSTPPQTSAQESMPQLLLVVRRDPKASAHDEATRVAFLDAVIGLMRNSGRYQVMVYNPTAPLIKHALLIHSVSSLDLAEPLQQDGMRHLALALGVRTMLFLIPTFDKTDLKMESQLHQNVGQDSWQIGVAGEATTPFLYGKRHLNSKEIVAISVDSLAGLLNLPSHLAADQNLKTMEAATTKAAAPKKPGKGDQAKNDPATKAVQSVPPDTQVTPDKAQTTETTITEAPVAPTVVQPTDPKIKESRTHAARTDKSNQGAKNGDESPAAINGGAPLDDRAGRADVPTVPTVAHPNYETLADHYHDNRDFANAITYLRYAVNERPRDVPLRQKLIQAYQEHKMSEAALAEITRALQIAPNDGGLYRAYGETLMTKGEVPEAEKAFRDAVRLNTADIQARIALGDALMLDNQYADALDSYMAAEKTDPRSPLPHRRLARVLLLRSAADPTQFAASLEEIGKARELTPKNDTITYQGDYGTLMKIMESRLRELLEEVSGNFIALTKGKQSVNDTLRALSDIQARTDSISGYLDKVPYAVGQETTQVHYQQAATQLLLCVTFFRNYLTKNDLSIKQQMQDASAQAYQELDTAHKRLTDVREALIPK